MPGMAGRLMQVQKPFKIEDAPTTIHREGVKRINVWYGPYTIKARNVSFSSWKMEDEVSTRRVRSRAL
jgi:hypothetical protein